MMQRDEAEKKNLNVLAKIKSWATCGVDPSLMGSGPIPASKKAMEKADWTSKDLDLIESNEAFAAQSIAVVKELKNYQLKKLMLMVEPFHLDIQ